MKMEKKFKKIAAVLFALAIIASVLPVNTAKAAAPSIVWTSGADGWSYLQGTDIRARQQGEMLTIEGNGELPDFDYWYLYQRPWNGTTCTTLDIGAGITYIGSYAFYNLSTIKYVFLRSTTFVADATCFQGIARESIFRIYGSDVTTKQFGTISVTSMDSISRMAQSNYNGSCYIMDSSKAVKKFQNSTNPTITNVFDASDEDAPWNSLNDHSNGGVTTSLCKITSSGVSASYGISAQIKYPGNACYEAFAAFIGDYNFAIPLYMTLYHGGEIVQNTNTEYQYTLTIPTEYRNLGTTYKLLAIGSGTVYTYDDLDSNPQTVTFKTDKPTTAYALIYK
jgi:hypothetical protein